MSIEPIETPTTRKKGKKKWLVVLLAALLGATTALEPRALPLVEAATELLVPAASAAPLAGVKSAS